MKSTALFVALLFAASVMSAQAPMPAPAPATPSDTKPTDPKAAPAKPAAATTAKPGDKKDTKKKDPVYVIKGTTIARPNGTFLGLEVVNTVFVLSFYDAKKKPMDPDVSRALARWPNTRAPGDLRTVLNLSGKSLVGSKPVTPPFNFNIYLTLMQGDGDAAKAVETYTVQMH